MMGSKSSSRKSLCIKKCSKNTAGMGEMDVEDKECQSPFMRDPHQDGICFLVVSFLPKPTLSALSGKKKIQNEQI